MEALQKKSLMYSHSFVTVTVKKRKGDRKYYKLFIKVLLRKSTFSSFTTCMFWYLFFNLFFAWHLHICENTSVVLAKWYFAPVYKQKWREFFSDTYLLHEYSAVNFSLKKNKYPSGYEWLLTPWSAGLAKPVVTLLLSSWTAQGCT